MSVLQINVKSIINLINNQSLISSTKSAVVLRVNMRCMLRSAMSQTSRKVVDTITPVTKNTRAWFLSWVGMLTLSTTADLVELSSNFNFQVSLI